MSQFSDGAIPYGTRHLDFYPVKSLNPVNGQPSSYDSTKRGTFICESFEANRGTYKVNQYNERRKPSGSFACDDFITYSCVVQISDITKQIQRYDAATDTLDSEIGPESFWVTNVTKPESQGEYWKQSVTLQQLVSISGPTATV